MIIGVSSDTGRVREINQDSYFCSEYKDIHVFAVADGMGGHNAGEVASRIAVETIKDLLYNFREDLINGQLEVSNFINKLLLEANEKILIKANEDKDLKGMGTTITLVCILENEIFIGHIGDSRAYIYSDEKLVQITEDHSLVAELVKNGTITEIEAINHPQKNVITRALGTDKEVKIDIFNRKVNKDDIIILCTDGLTNLVSEDRIKHVLIENEDVQKSCDILTNAANELGGYDNTTVIIIKID